MNSSDRLRPATCHRRRVAGVAIVALSFVGCTGTQGRSQPDDQSAVAAPDANASLNAAPPIAPQTANDTPTNSPTDATPVLDELARYNLVAAAGYRPDERAAVAAAWDAVFRQCAASTGSVTSEHSPVTNPYDEPQAQLARLRFDDIGRIRAEGYHLLFGSPGPTANVDGGDKSGGAAEIPVKIETRCKVAANSALGGGAAAGEADKALYTAQSDISERMRSAPELANLKLRWTECMAAKGYPNLVYDDASRMLQFVNDSTVTPVEAMTAVADSECRQATGLAQAQLDYLASAVSEWLASNQETVVAVRETIDTELSAANRLLGPASSD